MKKSIPYLWTAYQALQVVIDTSVSAVALLMCVRMAVISLAVQLAKGFIELYDFWGSVREAPEEVGEMLKDLQMLSSILNELITRNDPSPHVKDALEHCDAKVGASLL